MSFPDEVFCRFARRQTGMWVNVNKAVAAQPMPGWKIADKMK
jgi:hypothetical protein